MKMDFNLAGLRAAELTRFMIKPGNLKLFFPFIELPPEYVIIAASFASNVVLKDDETAWWAGWGPSVNQRYWPNA